MKKAKAVAEVLEGIMVRINIRDRAQFIRLSYLCSCALLKAGRPEVASELIRPCLQEDFNQAYWFTFCLSAHETAVYKAAKNRCLSKKKCWGDALVLGHRSIAITRRRPHLCLHNYYVSLRHFPLSPLLHLCLAVKYFHVSKVRTNTTKGDSYAYGLHHLSQYYHLRTQQQQQQQQQGVTTKEEKEQQKRQKKCEQEACFNVARAFHELGFLQMCIPFYELALGIAENEDKINLSPFFSSPTSPPPPSSSSSSSSSYMSELVLSPSSPPSKKRKATQEEGGKERKRRKIDEEEKEEKEREDEQEEEEEEWKHLDLKFEAAYNLSRLYFRNGFYEKSSDLIKKFMAV